MISKLREDAVSDRQQNGMEEKRASESLEEIKILQDKLAKALSTLTLTLTLALTLTLTLTLTLSLPRRYQATAD